MELDTKKLQIAMAQALMTQTSLAHATGMSQHTICRYINKKQKPTPIAIGKMANALHVPVEQIIR